jgi:hypothetical protein
MCRQQAYFTETQAPAFHMGSLGRSGSDLNPSGCRGRDGNRLLGLQSAAPWSLSVTIRVRDP